jgi:hypothetical protein
MRKRRPNFTTESFVRESMIIHGNVYDYSLTKFMAIKKPVEIICDKHGVFTQSPEVHLRGHGCFNCGIEKTANHIKSNSQSFIEKSIQIHGNLYLYELVDYSNNNKAVKIICRSHGEFSQTPASHLVGRGCPHCAKEKINKDKLLTLEEFVARSKSIHNDKYSYDEVIYQTEDIPVIIICKVHGKFLQTPRVHLRGSGCRKCVGTISKMETMWLDSLNVDLDNRQKTLKIGDKRFLVDAYDPTTDTIYEFYGDYWHGNPEVYAPQKINAINKKTFEELYCKTIEKESTLKNAGYNVISIWESDFNA